MTDCVSDAQEPRLSFVESMPKACPSVLADLAGRGKHKIVLRGSPAEVRDSLAALTSHAVLSQLSLYASPESPGLLRLPEITQTATAAEVDAVLLFVTDPFELSHALMDYADLSTAWIVAPATLHQGTNRTLLINSIPKSGTHLLFECAKAFGFQNPRSLDLPSADDDLAPGHFYNLQHMTLNQLAIPFHQSPDFIKAFSSSVVLFIYRDPRDIAVSMAHFLASQPDLHVLCQRMRVLDPADRLSTVIEGTYPLPVYLNRQATFRGTIRDLILRYVDWVRSPLPNCVPVRYEDLVGTQGGGDATTQAHTLWILQLALQVPGSPSAFAGRIYNRSTLTFREGRIGGYRREFTSRHHAQLAALGRDFLDALGYGDSGAPDGAVQSRPATFDHFQGAIPVVTDPRPRLLVEDWMGFNIVLYEGRYYALAQSLGDVDLTRIDLERLSQDPGCIVGSRLSEVKASIKAMVGRPAARELIDELRRDVENRLGRNLAVAQQAMDAARQIGEDLKAQVSDRDTLIEQLQARAHEQQRCQEEHRAITERLALELADVRRDLRDRSVEIEQLRGQDQALSSAIDGLTRELADVHQDLQARLIDIEDLKSRDETLRTGIDRLRQELEELRAARLFGFGPRLARLVRTPRPR